MQIDDLADQLATIDPELAERLRATPPWLTALLNPDYKPPTPLEQAMAARAVGRAHRLEMVLLAARFTGDTVMVCGPDGNVLHRPDGTTELVSASR